MEMQTTNPIVEKLKEYRSENAYVLLNAEGGSYRGHITSIHYNAEDLDSYVTLTDDNGNELMIPISSIDRMMKRIEGLYAGLDKPAPEQHKAQLPEEDQLPEESTIENNIKYWIKHKTNVRIVLDSDKLSHNLFKNVVLLDYDETFVYALWNDVRMVFAMRYIVLIKEEDTV